VNGNYVLQLTMLVGNTGTPYNSCGKLTITGGDPTFSCQSSAPILVYSCLQSGGPRPDDDARGILKGKYQVDF